MAAHVEPGAYKDVVLFLATAGVVVPLFRRWRISPILGFLGAGVLLGPHGLGALAGDVPWLDNLTIDNPDEVAQLAEFGVVFLLFMIGLELSWERLRTMRRFVFGLGGLQVALSIAVSAAAAVALGQPLGAAAAIGAALALSSTAIVMPILAEQRRQHSPAGRATFAVLLFQDLAVAPVLVGLSLLGRRGGPQLSPDLLLAFAPAVIGVVALVVLGRLVLRPMLRSVARARSEELFVAACLLVVIGAGLVSQLAGLSMALGAFIAGLLLAETEFRHEVEVTIEPFKGLLLGLFFVSIGIGLNVPLLLAHPLQVLGASAGFALLNAVVIFGLGLAFRLKARAAGEAALLLAGAGEFAFVILGQAMDEKLVDRPVGQTLLVAATLSMVSIPFLAMLAARPDFLARCGLGAASALVVTMDDPDGAEAIVSTARALRPDLTIVARARDARHAARLYDLGATDAVPETVEASLQLSEALLVEIGVPMGLVIASIHERRDEIRQRLNRPESLGGRARAWRSGGPA